jgi:pimeloyl-ACP methyl ester carboxylesterase
MSGDLLFKYCNRASRFMVIDKTLLHYRDEGQGPILLMLHGAFSSLHTWNDWTERLKSKYRVLRFDLIGFGLTGPTDDNDYSMEAHLRVVNIFLDTLNINEPITLIGSSLGGWLAWEYALHAPARIHKLVLVDAAGFLDDKSIPAPFKLVKMPLFGRMTKYVVSRQMIERYIRQVYHNQDLVTSLLIERYFELFTREGNPDAFFELVNQRFTDRTAKLKKITAPTLILWGEQDFWIPVDNAYMFLLEIPRSELVVYPECGHLPMEELAEASCNDLIDFLENF